jgi:glutathione S-transferase
MESEHVRLVTIPFSHYCEKARWALDRANVRYQEDGYLPMLAWVPALRAGGKRTVPVLVTPDGAVSDSTEILRWADRKGGLDTLWTCEECAKLEEEFDRYLGPAARRVAYDAMLGNRKALAAMLGAAPRWQARLAKATLPAMVALVRRGLRIEPATVARSREKLDSIFADVATRLADGRKYLTGARFSAADLTFAALAAPVVAPPGYDRWLPPTETWSEPMHALVDHYRATPAGAFALRVYRDHR